MESSHTNGKDFTYSYKALEIRQDEVLKKLDQIKSTVEELKKKFNIDVECDSLTNCIALGTPGKSAPVSKLDIVVNIDPASSLPLSVFVLCEELQRRFTTQIKIFVHCSVSDTVPEILQSLFFHQNVQYGKNVDIVVNLIWKKISNSPELIVDATSKTVIHGEANIVRYFTRLINPEFDSLDVILATKVDDFLDLSQAIPVSSSKERSIIIEKINVILGKQSWLVTSHCCVADLVVWSTLTMVKARLPANVAQWMKRCEKQDVVTKVQELAKKINQSNKTRPNYFVAVECLDPQIASVAKTIQDGIRSSPSRKYDPASFISLQKFHITLMVMALNSDEEIQRAIRSLENCIPTLTSVMSGQEMTLEFEGLGVFNNGRVLFTKPKESEDLKNLNKIKDLVIDQLVLDGIESSDGSDKQWNPHLTLMKMKFPSKYKVKRVEPDDYKKYVECHLGTQTIRSVQLCQMNKKREDGYYFVHYEGFFSPQT